MHKESIQAHWQNSPKLSHHSCNHGMLLHSRSCEQMPSVAAGLLVITNFLVPRKGRLS
jgi:hypothetical protein